MSTEKIIVNDIEFSLAERVFVHSKINHGEAVIYALTEDSNVPEGEPWIPFFGLDWDTKHPQAMAKFKNHKNEPYPQMVVEFRDRNDEPRHVTHFNGDDLREGKVRKIVKE